MSCSISRAQFIRRAALSAAVFATSTDVWADEGDITLDKIANDQEMPIGGNPNGDLTIVDFFDYNCPYCKLAAKSLERIISAWFIGVVRSCAKHRSLVREKVVEAVRNAGTDLMRLHTDLVTHAAEIAGVIKRTLRIAQAIGVQGTPVFLVGSDMINVALDDDGFTRAVTDARARQKLTTVK